MMNFSKLTSKLIFIYLILFPFGQLLKFKIFTFADIAVLLISLVFLISKGRKFVPIFNYFKTFIILIFFSLIFSLSYFSPTSLVPGLLYAMRFILYILFAQVIWSQYGRNLKTKKLILASLTAVGLFVAVFGWFQYFIFPDLRGLKAIGWDDHYFRLASTFLDPAFTGIILVLTQVLLLVKYVKTKTFPNVILNVFLAATIAFTYSRASYIALIAVFLTVFLRYKTKFAVLLTVFFLILLALLPRPAGEGVNLARTYSVNEKFKNYKESIVLFSKSPIFGIGFNNVCEGRVKFLSDMNPESHACNGLDSSLFFLLVTTGAAGTVVFLFSVKNIIQETSKDEIGFALSASFAAIFIHGSFTNTFFYSFILGWVAILIGVTRKAKV